MIPETDLKITGEGKIGNGFISSKHDKDEATGSLLSPEFQISRKYLNAKIGGGHIPGKVSLNLIIGDKIIDSVTGDRRDRLKWKTIDMSDHRGEMAKIQILDSETGGWGHILVDQILQSNSVFQQEKRIKEFVIKEKFLNFPMNHSNRGYRIDLLQEDEILGQFDTGLDEENPLFWGFIDVEQYKGMKITVEVEDDYKGSLDLITNDSQVKNSEELYKEKYRPRFHFSTRRGWINDPCGLVYYKGEYHMFYQYNPMSVGWNNMSWGHAVSKDMVHWEELSAVLYPDENTGWCFTGAAFVDWKNELGLKTGEEDVIVAFYLRTNIGL